MVVPSVHSIEWLSKELEQLESSDPLRQILQAVLNKMLSAEADSVCGAPYGMPSPDRLNQRNGYRYREFDTRVGTVDLAIPKFRHGSHFPQWLLQPRKRPNRPW